MNLLTLIIILLVAAAVFGSWGHRNPTIGYVGWSPLGIVLVIFLILWLTGNLGGVEHLRLGR